MVQPSTYNPLLSLARSQDIISSGIKFPVQMAQAQQDLQNAGLKNLLASREMRLKERQLDQKIEQENRLRELMSGMQGMSLKQQAEAMIRSGNPDLIGKGTSLLNAVKKGSPQTVVNIGGGEGPRSGITKAELEALGKKNVERLEGLRGEAEKARSGLIDLDIIDEQLAKDPDLTGAFGEAATGLSSALQRLGVPQEVIKESGLPDASSAEKFRAASKNLFVRSLQDYKDPRLNQNEVRILEQRVTNLGNTPEANRFISRTFRALFNAKIRKDEFVENYLNENPNKSINKAFSEYNKSIGKIPLVGKNPETGDIVYFNEVFDLNKGRFSESDIITSWKNKYATRK